MDIHPLSSVAVLEAVTKAYSHHRVLDNFSFDLRAGSVTALLGPNGVLSDQCESVSALRSKGRVLLASGHEQLPLSQGGGA